MAGIKFLREFGIVLILLAIAYSFNCKASDSLWNVKKFYIEVESARSTNRTDFRLKDDKIDGYLNLGYENTVGKYFYNKAKISSMMSSAQFRKVGLEMEFGVSFNSIDLYLYHESEHTLDMRGYKDFPQKNVIAIRFNFVKEE